MRTAKRWMSVKYVNIGNRDWRVREFWKVLADLMDRYPREFSNSNKTRLILEDRTDETTEDGYHRAMSICIRLNEYWYTDIDHPNGWDYCRYLILHELGHYWNWFTYRRHSRGSDDEEERSAHRFAISRLSKGGYPLVSHFEGERAWTMRQRNRWVKSLLKETDLNDENAVAYRELCDILSRGH